MNSQDYATAITDLTQSFAYDSTNANALYNLAKSYSLSGDAENAKTYYNKVIELFPNSPQAGYAQSHI